jgi:hypothetical protein
VFLFDVVALASAKIALALAGNGFGQADTLGPSGLVGFEDGSAVELGPSFAIRSWECASTQGVPRE